MFNDIVAMTTSIMFLKFFYTCRMKLLPSSIVGLLNVKLYVGSELTFWGPMQLFVHVLLTTISIKEKFPQDFLYILKQEMFSQY